MSLLAVEYIKADVSGRLLINAMPASDYQRLLATPGMKAILHPGGILMPVARVPRFGAGRGKPEL